MKRAPVEAFHSTAPAEALHSSMPAPALHSTLPAEAVRSNADWLDHGIAKAIELSEIGASWLLGWALKIATVAGNFALHHWALTATVLIVLLARKRFPRWLMVSSAIAEHFLKKRIKEARDRRDERRRQVLEAREDAWLARASRGQFKERLGALEREARRHEEICDALGHKAFAASPRQMDVLDAAIEKHRSAAGQIRARIEQLTFRRVQVRAWHLIDAVAHGPDDRAKAALTELNGLWTTVAWEVFAPDGMSDADKNRLIRLFQIMASTTQLGEARAAYAQARKIIEGFEQGGQRRAA